VTTPGLPTSKPRALAYCALAYVAALGVAVTVGTALPVDDPIIVALAADVAATVVVFLFSVRFDNSSLYDPYWSVAPVPIAVYWAVGATEPANAGRMVAVFALVGLWAARLTYNWIRRWHGLTDEDWRYVDIRRRSGRAYWPASFLGIHLFPTLVVFVGCLPLHPALTDGARPFGVLDAVAIVVTAAAIAIEGVADQQLRRFQQSGPPPGATLTSGLWGYSRHPNYFGEILFWWGVFLFGLAAAPERWWMAVGALSITVMFRVVSIPMIDERMLARRPQFAVLMRTLPAVIPWPRRSAARR
jgi:steroid 5-alpha reductase family enzyme